MATLTVNSPSITPGLSWPVDSSAGIIASTTKGNEKVLRFVADGESLPSSSTAGD